MGYHLEFNCLLVAPSAQCDLTKLEVGAHYLIEKEQERLYPLNIPIEICNENYQYYGKIAVRKLTLETGKTTLDIEVLKVFTSEEAAVYTNAYVKPN